MATARAKFLQKIKLPMIGSKWALTRYVDIVLSYNKMSKAPHLTLCSANKSIHQRINLAIQLSQGCTICLGIRIQFIGETRSFAAHTVTKKRPSVGKMRLLVTCIRSTFGGTTIEAVTAAGTAQIPLVVIKAPSPEVKVLMAPKPGKAISKTHAALNTAGWMGMILLEKRLRTDTKPVSNALKGSLRRLNCS